MSDFSKDKSPEKWNGIDSLRRAWAKSDIQRLADKSLKKLDDLVDDESFKRKLEKQAESKEAQRAQLGRHRRSETSAEKAAGSKVVYEAKAAAERTRTKKQRRTGFIGRTVRLIKGFNGVNAFLKNRDYVTCEMRSRLKKEVLNREWQPECQAVADLEYNLWDFMSDFANDAWDIVLFIADIIIKICYYLASLGYFLYDVLWDVRIFLEQHKHKLFLWFSSIISAAAVLAITVSSVSAFEYSYYGKTLGIARSKQDVYRTMDVLGEKLSEATGANINLDVQRDMQFKRVYGFDLDVDSADTILNTVTYMKDLQADAFAIQIDGSSSVILKSTDAANEILENYKNDFVGEKTGVEYSVINFMETVTVEPVQVLLGDIWNEDDALKYLETGSVKDLAEGEEAVPKINIYSVETATYEQEVAFGTEYIENTSLYKDELKLFTQGVPGKDVIVAEIVRYNGVEQSRKILSSTRMSNPINAVYYKGTKPIPQTKGTGAFIFPLKDSYFKSAYFGQRYGIKGVNPVHQGNDYACPTGTHIYASDGGTVVKAGWDNSYGYWIMIDHGGLYQSIYAHCSQLFVKVGDQVYQGKHIANVGQTGIATGPHLHFEVRYNGHAINPDSVLY